MARRVAITGAGGQLGRRLVEAYAAAADEVLALSRPEFDITDAAHHERLAEWHPDLVINAAAWTDVDACAREPERAMRINGVAAGEVAAAAARADAMVIQVSTNEVFDGALERPYREDDATNPINPYGASKLAGERLVAKANPRHLIVRTAWLYDPERERGFPSRIHAAAERAQEAGQPLRVVADEWGNPTPVTWLSIAIRAITDRRPETTVLHVAGWPPATRFDWAREELREVEIRIEPMRLADFRRDSRVPPRAVLDLARLRQLGIEPVDWRLPGGRA